MPESFFNKVASLSAQNTFFYRPPPVAASASVLSPSWMLDMVPNIIECDRVFEH